MRTDQATLRLLPLVLLAAATTIRAVGANWPAWRGPEGNGICAENHLPLHWSTNQNVRWFVSLPGPGNSTPVVWGQRVFVTQSLTKEQRRTVMCLDPRDGTLLWQAGTTWTEKDSGGSANPPCSPSPVTDGQRVIAWFGSAGVFCWDLDGRELWRRDLGRQSHGWGYASSPILYRDLCVLNFGPGQRSFLVALDKRTGKTVWQYDLPAMSAKAKWEDYGGDLTDWKRLGSPTMPEVTGSTATPLWVHAASGDEIVLAVPLRVMSFAPRTGEVLWRCDGLSTGAYSSPLFDDGLVIANSSGLRNAVMAIRPGGRGDVTATHRLWHLNPPASKACIGSGVIDQGHVYQITTTGSAQCLDLKTGRTVWDARLKGTGTKNSSWSSFVLAGDRLYVPNQNADVFVLHASPTFECLATNSLGGEPMNASLAVADGAIFLRTHRHLWCVATGPAASQPERTTAVGGSSSLPTR
jgi:outer membrane protein assembly factor BamB